MIDDLLYFVNSDGIASCVEADTGEVIWKDRVPGKFSASPLYADGRIYCFNEEGVTTVLKAGRRFEALATNSLSDEPLMASPAAVGGWFYLRSDSHVYRVGEGA